MSHSKDQLHLASAQEVERLRQFYHHLAERCEALTDENTALRNVLDDVDWLREENQRLSHENIDFRRRIADIKTDAVQKLLPLRTLRLLSENDDEL